MRSDQLPDTSASLDAAIPADKQHEGERAGRPISFRRRLRRTLWHLFARQFTWLSVVTLHCARLIGRKRRPISSEGCKIMLTGRFDSDNWILAHIGPLAASRDCSHLWMVSTSSVPQLPKVTAIYPPKWLMRAVGATPARLLTFLWAAIRKHPHIVGGFHLTFNGIAAIIVGRLAGARSMYFCVGGPPEVRDGGVHADDHAFAKMEVADAVVERRLLKIVSQCDKVITMGTRAETFFRNKRVEADIHVISGGIDSQRFQPNGDIPSVDLILTGRLVHIKRIDVFLRAIKGVVSRNPDISVAIVGDGKLRSELQSLSVSLGIDANVAFVGRQENVEVWLRSSRIFVLTSDSEGLSLSLMEAMMCGLPAVVSDVGDLGDLVEDGVNGYLVPRRSPELFAERLVELLSNEQKLRSFSQAAHRSAMRYETRATIQRWDCILAEVAQP
jgi:hypothetical protein